MNEEKTAQLRVRKGYIVEGRSPGTVFFTTPSRARQLLDQMAVEIVGNSLGPTATKPVGPTQFKEQASSAAQPSGPSTASQSSIPDGEEKQSRVSEEVQASPKSKPRKSAQRKKKAAAKSSPSTPRISLRRGRT